MELSCPQMAQMTQMMGRKGPPILPRWGEPQISLISPMFGGRRRLIRHLPPCCEGLSADGADDADDGKEGATDFTEGGEPQISLISPMFGGRRRLIRHLPPCSMDTADASPRLVGTFVSSCLRVRQAGFNPSGVGSCLDLYPG